MHAAGLRSPGPLLLQKPAGTLPIRKHKFTATPSTGQAITKFFDKKEEQVLSPAANTSLLSRHAAACLHCHATPDTHSVPDMQARLQQQLSKPRPAGPPPTFSGQAVGPRAQDATVGPATAKATNAAPATKSAAQPGVVHVTSAALPHVQPQQSTHDATDTLTARLTSAHHQDSTVPLQQQPVTARADAPVNVKPASEGVALASTSVDGFQQPRQRSRTQPSLEFVSPPFLFQLTTWHSSCFACAIMLSAHGCMLNKIVLGKSTVSPSVWLVCCRYVRDILLITNACSCIISSHRCTSQPLITAHATVSAGR